LHYSNIFKADEHTTEALWTLSLTFFVTLSQNELNNFIDSWISITGAKDSVNSQNDNVHMSTISSINMHIIEWVLIHPFSHSMCEEKMNKIATILGKFVFAGTNILSLIAHFHDKESKSLLNSRQLLSSDRGMLDLLFSYVDEIISTYCGISDGSMSFTVTTTQCLGTFDSIHSTNRTAAIKHCSSQVCVIHMLFSLCQNVPIGFSQRSLLVEKGVLRIFRFWIISATSMVYDKNLASNLFYYHDVENKALQFLTLLRKHEIIGPDSIPNFDNGFVPGLFCEILSRVHATISQLDMNTTCFRLLADFLRNFVVLKPLHVLQNVSFEGYDCSVFEILKSFDSILPLVIAGLILEQDYDSLCKSTKFRLLLLSKLKLIDRKTKSPKSGTLNLLGSSTFKKRVALCNMKINSEDLSRQTSKLCVLEDPQQPILSEILKQLLLVQEKSPFIFFQKTVVQSKVSLSTLLRKTEFAVLEGMIWILGQFEMNKFKDYYHEKSWNSIYCNQAAFQALKKGSLLLNRPTDSSENYEHSQSQNILSDSTGKKNAGGHAHPEDLVEQWIHKHFMGLLVSITTKWKRGRLETKVLAMGALRVLVRFLNKEDAPQFITHVFGIVDGSMHIDLLDKDDRSIGVLHLYDLAIKTLSHFVRTLLLLQKKAIVGENLCNIIVSIYPLFREQLETESFSNVETKGMLENIRQNAVEIVEYLVDDTIGQDLMPFFQQVPFLPNDSKFHHVRDVLKRNGLNFDSILLVGTQTQCDGSSLDRNNVEEERSHSSEEIKLQSALSCRLSALSMLLGHENENVRKICISHIIEIVLSHRSIFLKLLEIEDAANKFLTVQTDNQPSLVGTFHRQSIICLQSILNKTSLIFCG
jgi:predicted Holliday junction resolvase-like endonuclease